MKILVVNGPNLNFLGIREPEVYGTDDYAHLTETVTRYGKEHGAEITFFQSNHEGAIIDRLQEAYTDGTNGIIINPGAYAHTSIALYDALMSIRRIPAVEVHLSDISEREPFRAESITAKACRMLITGRGIAGYLEAADALLKGLVN